MRMDFGKLTAEETAELLAQCIDYVTEEELFRVLNEKLTIQQKEELGESWFNIDR